MLRLDRPKCLFREGELLMSMAWRSAVVWGLLLTLSVGCGGETDPRLSVKTYPLRGKLFVGGKPAAGVAISFLPKECIAGAVTTPPLHLIGAQTDEYGDFEAMTNGVLNGVPAGNYIVSLSWRDPQVKVDREGDVRGKQLAPAKYLDPRTSDIQVDVPENDLPITLELKVDRYGRKPAEVLLTSQ